METKPGERTSDREDRGLDWWGHRNAVFDIQQAVSRFADNNSESIW